MGKLMTLTVPDVLWINLQLTKTSKKYNYARLEEGVFYQYAYGGSQDVVAQAARFITGFVEMRPLESANGATAFVALMAFLGINGKELTLADENAEDWVREIWGGDRESAEAKIEVLLNEHEVHGHHGVVDKRDVITAVMDKFPNTIAGLLAGERDLTLI